MTDAAGTPWPTDGTPWPTATTRPVALLGWPARHSRSPQLHNAAFAAERLDLVYLALPVPPDAVAEVIAALGTVGALGANVTVPHKRTALEVCDTLTAEAQLIGAVNTLVWGDQGLLGDNTDAAGLRDAVAADVAPAPGERFVVVGTGGAARAAVVALGRLGAQLTVVGRRADAAAELASLGEAAGAVEVAAHHLDDHPAVRAAVVGARAVLNATPLGMHGEHLPDAVGRVSADQVAYDLVYDPPVTPFLAAAERAGALTVNGASMLVRQAGASFTCWTGRPAPLRVMAAALGLDLPEGHGTG